MDGIEKVPGSNEDLSDFEKWLSDSEEEAKIKENVHGPEGGIKTFVVVGTGNDRLKCGKGIIQQIMEQEPSKQELSFDEFKELIEKGIERSKNQPFTGTTICGKIFSSDKRKAIVTCESDSCNTCKEFKSAVEKEFFLKESKPKKIKSIIRPTKINNFQHKSKYHK